MALTASPPSPNAKKSTDKPSRPMLTTLMPITLPLRKATRSPASSDFMAAAVVRVLARVAMLMPMKPVSALVNAPMRKHSAVCQLMSTARMAATTTAKMASVRYSWRRNACAPWRMARPIFFIASVPSSCESTFARDDGHVEQPDDADADRQQNGGRDCHVTQILLNR